MPRRLSSLTLRPRTLARPLAKTLHLFLIAALLAGFAFALQPAQPVYALIYDVDRTDDPAPGAPGTGCTAAANDCSLRQAIIEANANPGLDTITFDAAVTDGVPIVLTIAPDATPDDNQDGDLDILVGGGDLTIQGNGAGATIIDGGGIDRVFHVCPASSCAINVAFNGVTIQNGNTVSWGGGILNGGTTTVDASTVSANTATSHGGGILNGATLNVQTGSVIGGAGAGNTANGGGGIYNVMGTTTVDAGSAGADTATSHGGGIFSGGTLNVQNGSVIGGAGAGNTANFGGGIYH
ncbi:MAG: hypothetical protein ACETWR_03240, partial [Anaerolineae bacterium]